jgi:hypothetical protein
MMRHVWMCGLACVLVASTGAYGDIVSVPIAFSGPGNSLTASGTVLGSLAVSGSGGMYTWDNVNKVWVGQTFTVPSQAVPIQSNPAYMSLSSVPTGSMTINIDNGTYHVDSFFDVFVDLTGGGGGGGGGGALAYNLATSSIIVNLDAGGSTTIDLNGSGKFTPVTWNGPTSVLAGLTADVSASAGPIPMGYLFHASTQQTLSNNVATSFDVTPEIGPWYKFGVDVSADFENITLNLSDSGSFSMNTYSGSQYPYYALTLNYDLSGCAALCNVDVNLSGTGLIPEPTTLALLVLGPAALWVRRRS